ncbi:3-oxoacyl-ACP reductase family protein [Sorangium sp. So ce291]|uniref:SDR family NAD(P)-dependent oxidoreductase n=1 Tax=Sorangium sp. So ce291 TaxID=3133294 RepID=UPI003F639249
MRLQGKIALVTGSSRGIGRSIAVRFAREGADVAITYHKSKEGAEEVLAEVESAGRRGHLFSVDVASVQSVQGLIKDTVAHFGRLDVLVNNAGLEKRAPFWDATEEDYDQVMNTNLKAVFFGSQAMVRHLREARRPGKIINISSVHEDLPFPNFASYCASKGGVRMLTRTLAVELRGMGITVNAIAPGAIETEINAELLKDRDKLNALLGQIPLGRLGKPEDVAGLAVFLASADADYVTGSTYFVDGGLTWDYEEQ